MATAATTTIHGLTYPPDLLRDLETVAATDPDSPPHQSRIHKLSTSQFNELHLRHILSHPEDDVLFPFLHGLEGQNDAQNQFFASQGMRPSLAHDKSGSAFPATVPNCRNLMWVICEDDLDSPSQLGPLFTRSAVSARDDASMSSPNSYTSSLFGDEDEEDEDLDEDDMDDDEFSSESMEDVPASPIVDVDDGDMNVDIVDSPTSVTDEARGVAFDIPMGGDKDQAKHMHPVQHRQSNVVPMSVDAPSVPASPSKKRRWQQRSQPPVPILTSSLRERDLITPVIRTTTKTDGSATVSQHHEFIPPRVPDGISLRNFGIQVPIVATLSDFVVYSPKGCSRNALELAERLKSAIDKKRQERVHRLGKDSQNQLLTYNVFVLDANAEKIHRDISHLVVRMIPSGYVPDAVAMQRKPLGDSASTTATADLTTRRRYGPGAPNTVDFAQREQDEMRDLTKASEIITVFPSSSEEKVGTQDYQPLVGQVFLGNSNDVPYWDGVEPSWANMSHQGFSNHSDLSSEEGDSKRSSPSPLPADHPLNPHPTNIPEHGMGYDICIECHDLAPFPTVATLRAAEERIEQLEELWRERQQMASSSSEQVRPPPHANSVVHLSLPSSPAATNANINSLMAVIKFLETCLSPVSPSPPANTDSTSAEKKKDGRRWSSVPALIPSFSIPASSPGPSSMAAARLRSLTSAGSAPSPSYLHDTVNALQHPKRKWSRPLKVLLHSADGYTESSVPALCLLMAIKELSLPEAYLELQVEKQRSFFVYQSDLSLLRRIESRTQEERRGQDRRAQRPPMNIGTGFHPYSNAWQNSGDVNSYPSSPKPPPTSRPSAKSVSFAQPPVLLGVRNDGSPHAPLAPPLRSSHTTSVERMTVGRVSRPRANTLPSGMFGGDHQAWFNDPRFDGSFPSRVLPFLYLGNLAHASNAYMLHALGITHVVSVGECALIPPPNMQAMFGQAQSDAEHSFEDCPPSSHSHFVAGKGPGHHGSLWIEERAGRIQVLDIQGVCDDGIDTLQPQLEPICNWIENARKSGGKVLVHCRVGVSRSATVTIAYVMKHLNISLVDAYIIVRSRRLSVLIQPNMRLLYNLCGWEIKLAKERAGDDEERLRHELSSVVSWPFLAKEVHKLNEKYLR